jgi:hypothetical protein
VYLSAIAVLLSRILNQLAIVNISAFIGFNYGKVLLFGLVYAKAMRHTGTRRLVLLLAGATVLAGLVLWPVHPFIISTALNEHLVYARVAQCVVLATFALIYMEQFARMRFSHQPTQDPIYLLSIGQLLYSAGTVFSFSYDFLTPNIYARIAIGFFIATMGLIFNYLLTQAFLRAKPTTPEYQLAMVQ